MINFSWDNTREISGQMWIWVPPNHPSTEGGVFHLITMVIVVAVDLDEY